MTNHMVAAAVIYAKDMRRISAFYEAIAGFYLKDAQPGHVVLEACGFQLTVVAMPSAIAAEVEIADPPQRRERTPIKLVYFTTSLSLAREQAQGLGGVVDAAEHEWQFRGDRVCDGHDPEGNVFQLRERALA